MSEKTGFMTVLLLFGVFIIPLLINTFVTQVEGSKLMARSAEVRQMISSEGGVTPRVQTVVDQLEEYGVTVIIEDKDGNEVTGRKPVGEEIFIRYKYKDFDINNRAMVTRRS